MHRVLTMLACLVLASAARAENWTSPTPAPTPDACAARLDAQRAQFERQCDDLVSIEVGRRVRQCERLLQEQQQKQPTTR